MTLTLQMFHLSRTFYNSLEDEDDIRKDIKEHGIDYGDYDIEYEEVKKRIVLDKKYDEINISTFNPLKVLWGKHENVEKKEQDVDEHGVDYALSGEDIRKTENDIKDDEKRNSTFYLHIVLEHGL